MVCVYVFGRVLLGSEARVSASLRSSVREVRVRQCSAAQALREGAQGSGGEELTQAAGPDPVCPQHPPVLLPGALV